jgi:hypothetical protein
MGRKILGMVTILALILGVGIAVPVVAAEVTVSLDAPAQVSPDSDFTVNVNIGEVTGFDACNYDVSFDASVLRLDNVTSGLIGSTTIPVDIYNEVSSGMWRIIQNVPGLTGASGSGYLAVLHFHVIGSAGDSSTMTLSSGVLANNLAQEIVATWAGDSVNVMAPAIPVSIDAPAQAAPDSDFTANVNISEVTDFDACNYDVSFDASVLRLDNVTSGLIGSTMIPVDIYNEVSVGTWRVVQNVPGMAGVSGSGYLAVLHFHVIGSGGDSSNITLSSGTLSNNLAQEIVATWTGDSISVADATPPSVTITPLAPDPTDNNTPTFAGTATDTFSSISSVEYRIDQGSWMAATASDGAFDSLSEGYTFTTDALSEGEHTAYVRATDVASNTTAEANYASDSFTVQTVAPGDANGDGTVDVLDITRVERAITGLDVETTGADANGDGVVNVLDITQIERIIVGLA